MRSRLFALSLFLAASVALPAIAQVIPPPSTGRQLYISDRNGKVIERLQPNRDRYDVYDLRRMLLVGYAKMLGRRMIVYDLKNNIVATIRAEMLPPDSPLPMITVVRDPDGHQIGFLERQ